MAVTYNSRERPSSLSRGLSWVYCGVIANEGRMVELTGIEPVASSMPLMRSPS